MRKFILPILILILLLSLSGCGGGATPTSSGKSKDAACRASRDLVRQRLSLPNGVMFSTSCITLTASEAKEQMGYSGLSSSELSVTSYYESAGRRTTYSAIVRYEGGDRWSLTDLVSR